MRDRSIRYRSMCLAAAVIAAAGPFAVAQRRVILRGNIGPVIFNGPVAIAPQPGGPSPDGFRVANTSQDLSGQLEQYDQHVKAGRWEKAFRVIEELNAIQPEPMVKLPDGFVIPLAEQTRRMLLALPADGRRAFDLFYGPKVRALLRMAPDLPPQEEVSRLREVVDHYAVAAPVAAAMDRLGDACFETGDFRSAVDCWKALIRDHPDSGISTARLLVKCGIAQARGGDGEGVRETTDELRQRFSTEKVRIGNAEVSALATLTPLLEPFNKTAPPPAAAPTPPLRGGAALAWHAEIPGEDARQAAINSLSRYGLQAPAHRPPPAAATDGRRVFISDWGMAAAINAQTGKEIWHTAAASDGMRNNPMMTMAGLEQPHSVTINGDSLLLLGVDPNNQSGTDLICVAAATGTTRWSAATQSLNSYIFTGAPMLLNGEILIGAISREKRQLNLLALDPASGAVHWFVPLGSPATISNGYGPMGPNVELAHGNGQVYVSTNEGAVIVVDPSRRRVAGAFTYPVTRAPALDPRFGTLTPSGPPGGALVQNGSFIFKDSCCDELVALRPADHQVAWKVSVGPNDVIVGADEHHVCLLGSELTAYRVTDGSRVWWSSLFGSGGAGLRTEPTRWTICGSDGLFQIDRSNGKVVGMLRGIEPGASGAAVLRVGERIILVNNTSVDAYDVSPVITPP